MFRNILSLSICGFVFLLASCQDNDKVQSGQADTYTWLEPRTGSPAVEQWVGEQNALTLNAMQSDPSYPQFETQAEQIYTASDRLIIPVLKESARGTDVYQFQKDATHPLGVWQKTTLADYKNITPTWDDLLDFQTLSTIEGKLWIPKKIHYHAPNHTFAMVTMQEYGQDYQVSREFDVTNKVMVATNPLYVDALRGQLHIIKWIDDNTLLFTTDFGPDSVTEKEKFPRLIKKLVRGNAPVTIFETPKTNVYMEFDIVDDAPAAKYLLVREHMTMTQHRYTLVNLADLAAQTLAVPTHLVFQESFQGRLLFLLGSDWQPGSELFKAGSVISVKISDLIVGTITNSVAQVWAPTPKTDGSGFQQTMLYHLSTTQNAIVIAVLDNVIGKLFIATLAKQSRADAWQLQSLNLPDNGNLVIEGINFSLDLMFGENATNQAVFVKYQNFLTPPSLYLVSTPTGTIEKLKTEPERFDASQLEVIQRQAKSKDGTDVPYFVVKPKTMVWNGTNPTIMYAYGGFNQTEIPYYSGVLGKIWLEQGRIYAQANIRGGGEFGEAWHQSATRLNRMRTYEDFLAVASDLIASGITSARHLGIEGVSNGGLLMGVAFTQRPDLFNAVWSEVGLYEMLRYTEFPGGTGQIDEYGDPSNPAERAVIALYSPFDNLHLASNYPKVFFETRTDDLNVFPGHSRKMAYKMMQMGKPVFFLEQPTGGHPGSPDPADRAANVAMKYVYFKSRLVGAGK